MLTLLRRALGPVTVVFSTVLLAQCSQTPFASPTSPGAVVATGSSLKALGDPGDGKPNYSEIEVCKSASSNVKGTFTVSRVAVGASTGTVVGSPFDLNPGQCRIVAVDNGGDQVGSNVTLTETSTADTQSVSALLINNVNGQDVVSPVPFTNGGTVFVNSFHGYLITFTNNNNTPPPPVCDFITFGRLVTEVGGNKVVISGNAGGNAPGGGILGEFHIDVNGVDNHVSDIASYGPIATGPLSGAGFPNSRIVTGIAKNGNSIELRLWDGGEPGKGTDRVYVKINGAAVLGTPGPFIDQGNMQYHPECRGPQ